MLIGILRILAEAGAGFDIVSGGELEKVLAAGGNAEKIVFSGVGKQTWEIEKALNAGIFCFNIESGNKIYYMVSYSWEVNIFYLITIS